MEELIPKDFGRRLVKYLRRTDEIVDEFRELKKTFYAILAKGISDTNRDEFNRLMKTLDSYGKELKELAEEQRMLQGKLVKLDFKEMKRELIRRYMARPKNVENVVEEKEELEEQVELEPSTLQTLQVEPHKDVADVEDVKGELDNQVGPRPSTLQASKMDDLLKIQQGDGA